MEALEVIDSQGSSVGRLSAKSLMIQGLDKVVYLLEVGIKVGKVGSRNTLTGIDDVAGSLEFVDALKDDQEKRSGLGVSRDGAQDVLEVATEMSQEIVGAEVFGFGAETVHGPLVKGAAMDAASVEVMAAEQLAAEGDLAAVVSGGQDVGA